MKVDDKLLKLPRLASSGGSKNSKEAKKGFLKRLFIIIFSLRDTISEC